MDAVDSLATCLLEMAEAKTNPVLEVINPEIPFEENKKYPPDLLEFNQLGWRAYYHCHPASRTGNHRFKGEHGHFHIFVRLQNDPEQWAHLAALAMDNMGQPLGWFTVNHWVTGEMWEDSEVLVKYLDFIPFAELNKTKRSTNLVERWLLSFIELSRDKVKMIIQERDNILHDKQRHQQNDVKQDKQIYLLSEIPINIKHLLNIS